MSSMRLPAAAAVCALLTATGFAPAVSPGTEEVADDPDPSVVDAYMEALAAGSDPDRMREGLALTAEGSPAHDYLTHRASVAQAWHDQGEPREDADVEHVGQGYELCRADAPEPVCETFTGFTHEEGRLVDLLVDDIDPGPLLVRADGVREDHEGVRAVFLSAYRSQADDTLEVTVEFNTVDDVDLDLLGASYTTDEGVEIDPALAVGSYELDAATATRAAFFFPSAKPGGDLRVGGCLAECSALVDITLPVTE